MNAKQLIARKFLVLGTATLMLSACQPQGGGYYNNDPYAPRQSSGISKEGIGTVAGAGLGAWAGSGIGKGSGRTVAMIGGALLGGFLGNNIGSGLDKADRLEADRATQYALETGRPGQPLPWNGPNASGTVVPSNYYQQPNGAYCREYTQNVSVGGRSQQAYGTACRQPDGTWQVVSQ